MHGIARATEVKQIDGTMKKDKYLRVLNDHAFSYDDRPIGQSFVLQQDNAPCHKAYMITEYLRDVEV